LSRPRHPRRHIAFPLGALAHARIAPAAAAGGAEGELVARLERNSRRLLQALRAAVVAREHSLVDRAGLAAGKAPGRILGALVVDVGDALLQRAISEIGDEPAEKLAGAATIVAQRRLLS